MAAARRIHIFVIKLKLQVRLCMQSLRRYTLLLVVRGDNLQLFISPLLKYEGWLYNIIADKNFEINSLECPFTGGLKIRHTPMVDL